MKKFHDLYKEKVNEAEELQEGKILSDFRNIYGVLLEHYGLASIHELDENSQISFLTELNNYWSEEEGLSDKGDKFIAKRSIVLNENSTPQQKKNYLKARVAAVINETVRQSDLKWKLYDVIDEMYNQLNASSLREILTTDMITGIITETFTQTVESFSENIHNELAESAKPKKRFVVKVKAK